MTEIIFRFVEFNSSLMLYWVNSLLNLLGLNLHFWNLINFSVFIAQLLSKSGMISSKNINNRSRYLDFIFDVLQPLNEEHSFIMMIIFIFRLYFSAIQIIEDYFTFM